MQVKMELPLQFGILGKCEEELIKTTEEKREVQNA